jgi:hypothetical protein
VRPTITSSPSGRRAAQAAFLSQDRGSRRQRPEAVDDDLLRGEVRLGHDIAQLLAGRDQRAVLHHDKVRRRRIDDAFGSAQQGHET